MEIAVVISVMQDRRIGN